MVTVREVQEGDLNFIAKTLTLHLSAIGKLPPEVFFPFVQEWFPKVVTRVICPQNDLDVILGFYCYQPTDSGYEYKFCYLKQSFRNLGLIWRIYGYEKKVGRALRATIDHTFRRRHAPTKPRRRLVGLQ